jgi:cytoplasmic iron level regulating protein YaaA (DUF328/UPF0246 family)
VDAPVAVQSLLAGARAQHLSALTQFVTTDPDAATVALALPRRSATSDLSANRDAARSPRLPAIERYAGVVYDGLRVSELTRAARARAGASVLIFSGLWGVLRAEEPIPVYRLPVAAVLPGLGSLGAFWRPILDELMPSLLDDELTVDLRSSDYAAMWRPRGDQVVPVRVLSQTPGRPPAVVSYPSKLGKGRLARELLTRRAALRRPEQIIDAWRVTGGSAGWVTDRGAVELLT